MARATRDEVLGHARKMITGWSERQRRHYRQALEAAGHPPVDDSEEALAAVLVEVFARRHPEALDAVEGVDELSDAMDDFPLTDQVDEVRRR